MDDTKRSEPEAGAEGEPSSTGAGVGRWRVGSFVVCLTSLELMAHLPSARRVYGDPFRRGVPGR